MSDAAPSARPEVRLLSDAELPRILPLVAQLNPAIPAPTLAARLREMPAKGYRCVGAFIGGELIGIAGVWSATRLWCGRYVEADNVVVDERFRGHGIGQALMDFVHRLGCESGCDVAVLDAYVSNAPAARFYIGLGYDIVGFHYKKALTGAVA